MTLLELRDQLTALLDRGVVSDLPVAVDLTFDEGKEHRLAGIVSVSVEARCADPTVYLISDENEAIAPLDDAGLLEGL